jgi:hypothetical protein
MELIYAVFRGTLYVCRLKKNLIIRIYDEKYRIRLAHS